MRKIHFEPSITFGNLVSIGSILMMALTFAVYNERRLSKHEAKMEMHDMQIQQIQATIPGFVPLKSRKAYDTKLDN